MAPEDSDLTLGPLPLSLFCARLKLLQQAAGLTQTNLATTAHLSTSQMSDILNGKIKKPPDWDVVSNVVHVCVTHAKQAGKPLPRNLHDEGDWRRRYHDLEQDFDAAARLRRSNEAAGERTVATVCQCDPFDLGVHCVVPLPGSVSLADGPVSLTPYLNRDHDIEIRTALRRAAGGGPSVLAVLAGGSCTGKTRTLYEALREVVPDWPLLRPADADELLELLRKGQFGGGTVLWLNETQRHLSSTSGEQAATLLATTLAATNGAVAVGALWLHPYLRQMTAVGNSPDVHAAARALLDGPRTHHITVPDCLTASQQREFAKLAATDKRLGAALAASGADGDVIQHLTGGPELLHAYTHGGLFTPVEHALITAALDARRLGHQEPIPSALLAAAADGYLSPRLRPGHADWATSALTGLTTGVRSDGSTTGVRCALTALKAVRTRSGDVETAYEPDDYLDQHIRRLQQGSLGPRQLWDALAVHTTSPDDLNSLGHAADARGLYRHAALLWQHAITTTGNAQAAHWLIYLLHKLDRDAKHHAARWVAEHVALDDPVNVASLLDELREAGARRAVTTLLARHPAEHAALDDPEGATQLLRSLREAGARREITTLLARHPAEQAALHNPNGVGVHATRDNLLHVAWLLDELRRAGADREVTTLITRAARYGALDNLKGVAESLHALRYSGTDRAVTTLLARHPAEHAALDNPQGVAWLLHELRRAGARQMATTLLARHPAEQADLDNPGNVASLLHELRRAGANREITTLLARHPAEHAALDNPQGVAWLLDALREAGADQEVTTLATRAAEHATRDNLLGVTWLLDALRRAGADREATTLATRAAEQAALDAPGDVAGSLLKALREAGADQEVTTLATRAAEQAALDAPGDIARLLHALREAGADQEVTTLLARHPAEHAALHDPWRVAQLLEALREAGADQEVTTLATRAAEHAALDNPGNVASLLDELRRAGAGREVTTLATRAAEQAALDTRGVARLLNALREAGADQEVTTLLARHPAEHAALDNRCDVDSLLDALREAGADQEVTTLATRAADAGYWESTLKVDPHKQFRFGREPGGAASVLWHWQSPTESADPPQNRKDQHNRASITTTIRRKVQRPRKAN